MLHKIVVLGAPGNVGTEVVKTLQAAGADFRVGARNPESARQTFDPQPEIVRFDFLDPTTFEPTFADRRKLFLVRPPALSNVQRDIAPAIYAAIGAGVQHIVFLSLQGVENNKVTPHYKIEQLIQAAGITYTFLRAGFFMQNLSTIHRSEIRDDDEIAVPVGQARTSFIDVRDIGAVGGQVLTEAGHENKAYTLTGGAALTYEDVARTFSSVLGRTIRYTDPNVFRFVQRQRAQGQPWGFAMLTAALYTITRFGNAKAVTPEVRNLLGREPISFNQFVLDYRECWEK